MTTSQADVRSISDQRANPEKENVARAFSGVHTAMLIIHGVGEQNPYETLDRFARGVYTYISKNIWKSAELTPIEIAHKDWTQVGMRIAAKPAPTLSAAASRDVPVESQAPDKFVDVFEYYWAPQTEDKLSAIQTLRWALQTDFTPIHHIADNLQEIMGADRVKGLAFSLGKALWLYFVEFRRIFFIFLPLALGFAGLWVWLASPQASVGSLKGLGTDVLLTLKAAFQLNPDQFVPALLYFAGLLVVWFLLQFIKELHDYPDQAVENRGDRVWIILSGVLSAIFLALGRYFDQKQNVSVLCNVGAFFRAHWFVLAEVLLAYFVSYALTADAADVAVYVNADAKSKSYVARNAILKGSTDALKALLSDESGYDRVILAGHSLGSVIAYDSINDLLAEVNATSGLPSDRPAVKLTTAEFQKLKGLVTFGSPLDKVYYFFREQVKRDQALRAQILSMLHSFRRCASGRDYAGFHFKYEFRQLDDAKPPIRWLNAWARMDPVSSELRFYQPDKSRCFSYTIPVWSHTKYWSDPDFFDYFCDELL